MAKVEYTQNLRLSGGGTAPIDREEVLIDSAWHRFLLVMLGLGGTAVLAWLVWMGYAWGSSGCYTCIQNTPTATITPSAVPMASHSAPAPMSQPVPTQPPVIQLPVVQMQAPPVQVVKIEVRPLSALPVVPIAPISYGLGITTDAERRNEALKERLRRRYGIK